MIAYVDNNLFRLESEADKIVTYLKATGKNTLSDAERDAIIYTPIQINAFDVLDALLANDIKKANSLIDDAAIAMTPWPEYLGMLYW
jgi:DNA polymerase III delta subunit